MTGRTEQEDTLPRALGRGWGMGNTSQGAVSPAPPLHPRVCARDSALSSESKENQTETGWDRTHRQAELLEGGLDERDVLGQDLLQVPPPLADVSQHCRRRRDGGQSACGAHARLGCLPEPPSDGPPAGPDPSLPGPVTAN